MSIIDTIQTIKEQSLQQIKTLESLQDCDQLKSQLTGKKSPLSELISQIPSMPPDDRPVLGKQLNQVKQELLEELKQRRSYLQTESLNDSMQNESTDPSLPSFQYQQGATHPLTLVTREICDILSRCGFSIKQGPDIETDFYNFEALNIPSDHPARDMHDTFYLQSGSVLRTHTSPVQIRTMLEQKPPLKIIAPGKVYRCDADVSHSPVFHQVEGLCVNSSVTFADLKATLEFFLHELFGHDKKIRFRSSYFPFTEPSVEIDVECSHLGKTGWLEIMGAGMVQREVFRKVNQDPDKISGYAFGCGVERIAMIKYQIDDIRLFYENDSRFIKQFDQG